MLKTVKYEASDGIEYFMTYEDPEDRTIFSLLRLRIPSHIIKPDSQQTFLMTTDDAKAQEENRDPNRVLLPTIPDYLSELR